MLRSLYSGISGMKVNQTKLDVIGNNISNVGTTSFKASKARFQDMLSQNVKDAMGPSMNQGGVNSKQVGLGVQLASIDTVMTQGNLQPTGRALDLAVDGDGFFMVSKGPTMYKDNTLEVSNKSGAHNITEESMSTSGAEVMYSRDGSFILDESGNLLTSDGYRVLGYSLTNDNNGVAATGALPTTVSTSGLSFSFGPGSQLNEYKVQLGTTTASIASGTVTSASLDTTNKVITVNGDFSETSTVTAVQIESAINKALSAGGVSQRMSVSGSASLPVTAGVQSEATSGGTPIQSMNLNGSINFIDGTKDIKAYDESLKTLRIPDTVTVKGADTNNDITLRVKSYTIEKTGVINAVLEDGSVAAVGQIAMASFKNPEGLSKLGGNLYTKSANSGAPSIKSGVGTLGEDNSKGYGNTLQGMLEMSNVDLAEQFTDMIVANRAFQASGKMISTGDEVLQDIINLKR